MDEAEEKPALSTSIKKCQSSNEAEWTAKIGWKCINDRFFMKLETRKESESEREVKAFKLEIKKDRKETCERER